MRASRWVDAAPEGVVKWIPVRVSLQNRTVASQTSLRRGDKELTRSQLLRKLRRYRRLYRDWEPGELAWATPYVEMMAALTDRIESRF